MKFRLRPRRCYRRHKIPISNDHAALARKVIVLRHGSLRAEDKPYTWASQIQISELLGLSVHKVRRVIDLHATDQDLLLAFGPRARAPHWNLQAEHFTYLLDPATLLAWQPHSISARCRLFHRTYPDKRISTVFLRKFYKKSQIGYRVIKPGMALTVKQISDQTK